MGGDLLLADDGTLHAAWALQVSYKHAASSDGGLTWTGDEVLDWTLPLEPQLAATPGGGPVLLSVRVYEEESFCNLFYHELDSAGWSARRRINNYVGSCADNGDLICTTGGVMVAAWRDWGGRDGSGRMPALVASSDPGGRMISVWS
jgi:hypothetical protein